MKKSIVLLCAALCSVLAVGCVGGRTIMDHYAKPDKLYNSGKDYLSGTLLWIPNADDADQGHHELTLKKIDGGWDVSQKDAEGFDLFELTPEQTKALLNKYDPKTTQCAKGAFVTFCKAPKGTKTKDGKFTFQNDYAAIDVTNQGHQMKRK